MSPRDEFAAAALTGLIAEERKWSDSNLVQKAYELADEMVRQQKPESDGFKEFAHELLACVVADAWAECRTTHDEASPTALGRALDNLEMGTRASTLRKVRP